MQLCGLTIRSLRGQRRVQKIPSSISTIMTFTSSKRPERSPVPIWILPMTGGCTTHMEAITFKHNSQKSLTYIELCVHFFVEINRMTSSLFSCQLFGCLKMYCLCSMASLCWTPPHRASRFPGGERVWNSQFPYPPGHTLPLFLPWGPCSKKNKFKADMTCCEPSPHTHTEVLSSTCCQLPR